MRNKALVLAAALAVFSSAVPEAQARGRSGAFAAGLVGGVALGALAASSARAQPVYDDGYEYGPPEYYYVHRRRFVMREYEPPFEPLGFHDDWDD
ncbi:hypothetical protein SAMN04487843_1397 [Methylobacterium sp. ap11]|uniref:hypothetical protein n=1 Tax=Methylobacterium sp. ap11 TaxID=1761799 RepID=UPI0008D8AF11|nr:hypothetical protein [Methylobacterium sp. ap11]SEP50668.1 hypothetical protein SAMN04487843_1397 [Methylobacterium sp. ap11]